MKRFFTIIALALSVCQLSAQIRSNCDIIRDHKTPVWHIFDPSTAPDIWLMPTEKEAEMPLPTGINEEIRKEIDAKRTAQLRSLLQNRSILNDPQTPKSKLNSTLNRGVEPLPGSGTPNDNHLAVGNDGKIISVLNTVIRVHNDTGKLIKAFTLDYFANSPNIKKEPIPTMNRTYDPRVVYDPYTDRYIVVFMHGTTNLNSFIVVGFSSSNDPTKPWYVYKVPGTPIQDSVWSDYPIVSQTKEDIFFTVNLLHNGSSWEEGFVEAVIWQLNKDDGFRGDTLHKNFFHNIKFNGKSIWSICAIQNGPLPEGADNYFISVRPYTKENDTIFVHRITNTQRSGIANYELAVFRSPLKYAFPSSALQPDTSFRLRTNDARVLSGVRIGSEIHYFQNCLNLKTLQAHVMHGSIYGVTLPSGANPRSKGPLLKPQMPYNWKTDAKIKAYLYRHDSLDFGYPAVAAAGIPPASEIDAYDPSMLVTTGFSSLKEFPGCGMFYINRYGEHSAYQRLKKGSSIINYNFIKPKEQRWGDYEGIQSKYNEKGVFYLVGSYGKVNTMCPFVARVTLKDTVYDNKISHFRIFPVPTTESLNIEFQVLQNAIIEGEVFNIDGSSINPSLGQNQSASYQDAWQQIQQKTPTNFGSSRFFKIEVDPGTHRYALHSQGLSSGAYVLKLKLLSGEWSEKDATVNFKFIVF